MEIILREPGPGDIGWVISMHGKIYAQEFQFDSNFEVDIAQKVVGFFEKSNAFNAFVIAQVNGGRAGSIAVSMTSEHTAFINFLLVCHAYRGQGVGRELLRYAVQRSRRHKINRMGLETYSCLKDARNLYKKIGFRFADSNRDIQKYGHVFDQEFWEMKL